MRRGAGLALLVLATASPGAAQEAVRAVRMVADLGTGDGSARVRIEYVVGGAQTPAAVPARALDFGAAAIEDLRVGGDATPGRLTLEEGRARTAEVPLNPKDGAAGASVSYRVASAVARTGDSGIRAHLPVLGLELLPEGASPGLFQAELRLPPSWRVTEGFPTGLTATGEPGVYRVDLPVVPSVVSFRAVEGGSGWTPGVPLLLDVASLALLLAFSAVGWRHLRSRAA